jgi:hypothetical protein
VATLCLLGPLFCSAQEPAVSNQVSYLSFEVPGALGTYPMSINASMAVTGYYYVSPTETRGFLRNQDGAISLFGVPGALWVEPESINAGGDITGFYELVSGVPQGFVRYADGRMVLFDPPDAFQGPQSQPVGISDFDEIAGNYPYPLSVADGFTRSRAGVFSYFGFGQGAIYPTVVTGLNASGTVVGYFSVDGASVGFLHHPDGFRATFAVPDGPGYGPSFNFDTIAESVNANGTIAGWYLNCMDFCTTTSTGGFVYSPPGVFTLFNPPGTLLTLPRPGFVNDGGSLLVPHRVSINQDGSIAGSYTDAEGAQHGFVRNPYGTITSFDPPRGNQTTVTSINDAGVTAGFYYYDWNSQIAQGFLRIPKL